MNAKAIWLVVALVALFAGGFAAGMLYHHHAAPHSHEDRRARGHDAARFLEHFRRRLDLTAEQAAEVNQVLDRLHRDMAELSADFHGRFFELRSRAWTDIRATLSEQQAAEFEKLVEELENEHSHHAGVHGKNSPHRASNRHQGDSR